MMSLIVSALLSLFIPSQALAAAGEAPSAAPAISYFQYWVKYGDKAARPAEYRELSFELTRSSMSVFVPAPGVNFCGPVDKSVHEELSLLVAGLDLRDWKGVLPENSSKDVFDLLRENDGTKCVWALRLVFMDDPRGNTPARIRLSGMDDGRSPKRLRAEAALTRFFAAQGELARAATPRLIENVEYRAGSGKNGVRYGLYAQDGRVILNRTRQGERISEYVNVGVLSRLDALIQNYELDKWHGFKGANFDSRVASAFDARLKFDTLQEINARGNTDRTGGTPPHFAEVDAALRKLLDDALGGDAAGTPNTENLGNLREFSFSTGEMSADSMFSYEIYRRRDAAGPRMVLRRKRGIGGEPKEAILDKSSLDGLEACIRELNLSAWNGFRGKARFVLDGGSFGLRIGYADGTVIEASGSNAFPPEYGKRTEALFLYLDGLLDQPGSVEPR
ncbi:hypothetical protein ACQRA4_04740 [Desulfovibrio sp. SGI.169]